MAKSIATIEVIKNKLRLTYSRIYLDRVYKITNELLNMKPEYSSVYELIRNEDLNELKEHWLSVPANKELDERSKKMYSSGFIKLIEFLKSLKNNMDKILITLMKINQIIIQIYFLLRIIYFGNISNRL